MFRSPLRAGAAIFALALGSVSGAGHALAQTSLTLPSASLSDSLTTLSRQTGVEILADPALLQGKNAPAVRGASTPEGALIQLLRGTGLNYEKRGNAYLIMQGSANPATPTALRSQRQGPEAVRNGPAASPTAGATDMAGYVEMVVTGSRIARPELESPMPISVVNMNEAARLGRTTAYEALLREPAIAPGVGPYNSQGQTWDAGLSSIDLRNLGTNRTLTLLDGMRRVSGSARSSAVDLNMIPPAMIERIEIITGGAAAIYGADAVTGAVNIITKRDFEGLEISATQGLSEQGDAGRFTASVTGGGRFADGRGRILIGGTYQKTEELLARNRSFSQNNITFFPNPENSGPDDGIPDQVTVGDFRQAYLYTKPNFFLGQDSYYIDNGQLHLMQCDHVLARGEFQNCDGGDGGSLLAFGQLRGPTESLAIMGRFDYEVAKSIEFSSRFDYGRSIYDGSLLMIRDDHRKNAWFNGAGGSVAYLDNPYLPPALRDFMVANGLDRLDIRRVWSNFPMVEEKHDRENFTLYNGLSGSLGSSLTWQAYFQYGRTVDDVEFPNQPRTSHWIAGRDVIADPETGTPVCRDEAARAAGCVPFNIFSTEPPTQEQLDYLLHSRKEKRETTQKLFGASVVGDVITLPHGNVSVALGVEHRNESLKTVDDPLSRTEAIYPVAHPEIDASMSVSEAYGEVIVPVLRDTPFAKRLEIEGAYRYSDYTTIGSTNTWKIGAVWAPIEGLTFRGVRSRSVRAPNFGELYEPQNVNTTSLVDPCSDGLIGSAPERAANCAALGIRQPFPSYGNTIPITSGGNPNLRPETSNSLTLGAILQPRFLPGFDLTVDYWDINLKDAVAAFSVSQIMTLCVDLPSIDNPFCPQVQRGPDGKITAVSSFQINAAKSVVRGVDFGLNYRFPLGEGRVHLGFKGSYLIRQITETTPGIDAGTLHYAGSVSSPRFRGTLFTSYDIGSLSVALDTRFISASKIDKNAPSDEYYDDQSVPARIYNDLSVSYDVSDRFGVTLGVSNIFDVAPPLMPGLFQGSSGRFDTVGRYFFTSVKASF